MIMNARTRVLLTLLGLGLRGGCAWCMSHRHRAAHGFPRAGAGTLTATACGFRATARGHDHGGVRA